MISLRGAPGPHLHGPLGVQDDTEEPNESDLLGDGPGPAHEFEMAHSDPAEESRRARAAGFPIVAVGGAKPRRNRLAPARLDIAIRVDGFDIQPPANVDNPLPPPPSRHA